MFGFAPLDGQDPSPAQLVDLNVVATDGRGQPVTDLTRSDFQVTDSGKLQQIEFFRHNDNALLKAPVLGPNQFSNRKGAKTPHPTVVLFDLLNQRFATRGTSANQMVHELESLESSENLYLYLLTLDGRLYAVHGFPGSEEKTSQPKELPWTRGIKPLLDDALRTVLRVRPFEIDVYVRVQLTFNALDALAGQLSRFPGRKNIVWVTDGVPISLGPQHSVTDDYIDFTPQLRNLSEAFERSNVAIYPVRQVMLGSPDAMGASYGPGLGSAETLEEFAGMTGGRPPGSKDVGSAVRQAMNDVRTSYQIGYLPVPGNWDGKFHKLRVVCSRKGVRVQTRTGYYAWPEPPEARAERAVGVALSAGFDPAEIGLRGTLQPDAETDRMHAHLTVRIDASDVAFAQNNNRHSGFLGIAVAAYYGDGRTVLSPMLPLSLNYDAEAWETTMKEGIEFLRGVSLEDGLSQFRVVVFDYGSNALGSLTIPVASSGKAESRR
jgi:VWFA-related protein